MQLGRLEVMDQVKDVNTKKLEIVNKVEPSVNQAIKKEDMHKVSPKDKVEKIKDEGNKEPYEVSIDNLKFGFDDKTGTFIVKVKKQEQEYQYPTEEMLRLKFHMKETIENILE